MRNRNVRVIAAFTAIVLILAGCSKPADREAADRDRAKSGKDRASELVDPEGSVAPEATGGPAGDDGTGAGRSKATVPAPIENPAADVKQQLAVGQQVRPQSTDFPGGNRNTWNGVDAKSIRFAAGYDAASCGADLVGVLSAAGGALPTDDRFYRPNPSNQDEVRRETEETIRALVRYFNETAWADREVYPHLKPIMEKFGSPEYPFYGRKITYETFDSGSFQCPDKVSNTPNDSAVKNAFATFVDRWDGTPTLLADALNAKVPASRRPMTFGTLWLPDSYYSNWAPYVWTQFSSGSTIVRQYASWVCSRLVGKKASNSPDYKDDTRKFGLLYPNRKEDKDRVAELKANLQKFCGRNIIDPAGEKSYTFDLGRATDEGQQIMLQFQRAGITSVLMLTDPVIPLFQMNAASSIGYNPEWVFSSIGYADSNTVQRLYPDGQANRQSFGLSMLGVYGGFAYGAPPPDPFMAYHHSHRVAPNGKPCDFRSDGGMDHSPDFCKAPRAIATYYYTVLPLIGGLLFAGPNLTPQNVSKGLQAYPETRFGVNGPTSDPRPALVGAGPGKYSFIIDAVEWRWRQRFTSPYPEHKAEGWIEYTDCQRHYLEWPNKLAKFWEKGGPNYNAWCGDAKYAPADSAEKDGYPRITEGTKP